MIPITSAVFCEADLVIKICELTTAIGNTDNLRQNKNRFSLNVKKKLLGFSSNTNLVGEVNNKSPNFSFG